MSVAINMEMVLSMYTLRYSEQISGYFNLPDIKEIREADPVLKMRFLIYGHIYV